MKANKFKNENASSIEELNSFMTLLASLNRNIEFYALGGTAMVLAGIKPSTRDIDFLTTLNQSEIKEVFEKMGLEEIDDSPLCNKWKFNKKRLDIFFSNYNMIMGFPLIENWKELSFLHKELRKAKIFILDWEDIISTKLARGELRDFEDIITILKKEKIDFIRFESNFKRRAEICAGSTSHCLENLKFLREKIKDAKI